MSVPYLSLAIFLPIFWGVATLFLGRQPSMMRWFALLGALLSFAATVPLYFLFDPQAGLQFVEKVRWVYFFDINYALGLDGISFWFVPLTAFITVIVVISAWNVNHKPHQYLGAFLILSGILIGVFCALDGILFYIFFEATLIPMYLIIGIWGGEQRIYASFKFFLYTLLGSLVGLIALLYLYNQSGSFDIFKWHHTVLGMNAQFWIFLAFFAAFAVKIPMFPFHTWLPDAHVQAPTAGSVVLAAIMLKLGGYGFLRFSLPITPDASQYLAPFIVTLSLIAVVYISLVALVQKDMKKLVAYSSIAHMGFSTLGFFILNPLGAMGGVFQMISHGFISAAMFLCIGVLYDRLHTKEIAKYGGVAQVMPKYVAFLVFFSMANAGLPGTSGFVGEFLVILGAVKFHWWVGVIVATGVIWGAAYSLWMVKRVAFGEITNPAVQALKDLDAREFIVLSVLALCVLWMGVYPEFFTSLIEPSVTPLLKSTISGKLPL